MKTFRATAEEMLNLEKNRRESADLNQKRSTLEVDRRKLLAEAEALMKEGKFKMLPRFMKMLHH